MKMFLKGLKRLRLKIHIKFFLTVFLLAMTVAAGANALVILMSKLVYVYGMTDRLWFISIGCLSVAVLTGIFLRPSDSFTVYTADSMGYKERFVTAYEALLRDTQLPMERLAVEDALKCSRDSNFGKGYSVIPHKRNIYTFAVALAVFILALVLPIKPSEAMERQDQLHQRLDAAVENMQQEVEESALTETQKREVSAQLKELKKELSKVDDGKDALSKLMDTQGKLKKLADESENPQLMALSESLRSNPATQELGEMLKNGNITELTEAISQMNDSLANMSEEEIAAFGDALRQAAENTELDEETRQLLTDLGNSMQQELTDEQLAELSGKLSDFSERINELASENSDIREAVEKINKKLAETGEDVGGKPQCDGQLSGEQTGGPNEDAQAGKQGASSGNTPGTSEGKGKGSIENADIYTSKAGSYGEYDAELDVKGEATGESVQKGVEGGRGEMIPYTNVLNEYKNEALNSIESEDIPYGVKDIVRDYFSSLE